jgi:resuscitation-promoting factor RpfB
VWCPRITGRVSRRGASILALVLLGAVAGRAPAADLPPGQPPAPAPGTVAAGSPADPVCGPVAARPGPPRCAPSFTAPANPLMAAIVRCETGGNADPRAVDGRFEGLYQFSIGTWRSVGGKGRPSRAPAGEQHYRAWLLWLRDGLTPWPVCAKAARAAASTSR